MALISAMVIFDEVIPDGAAGFGVTVLEADFGVPVLEADFVTVLEDDFGVAVTSGIISVLSSMSSWDGSPRGGLRFVFFSSGIFLCCTGSARLIDVIIVLFSAVVGSLLT